MDISGVRFSGVRFHPLNLIGIITLFVVGISRQALAGESYPALLAPPSSAPLHVAVPFPKAGGPDAARGWRLIESGDTAKPVSVWAAPAILADGSRAEAGGILVGALPGRAEAASRRSFRLEPAALQTGKDAAFRFSDISDKSVGLWEGDRPVLVYNHGVMSKSGVPANRSRSTYVHPLYGLDGEVLTDDFPKDHYHHRGLFWAWPHVRVGDQHYSLWDLAGLSQRFERWLAREAGDSGAALGVENGWYVGDRKVLQERVWLRVYPAPGDERILDIEIYLIPVGGPLSLEGAEGKSYGGLTLRFAPNAGTVITTPLGQGKDDLPITRLPWADLSARLSGRASPSGAAIFIAPDHPDFPPEWLTRHYGVLCVGWPGVKPRTFQPGEAIRCRYRLWIHRGAPDVEKVKQSYQAFELAEQVKWEGQ